MTAQAQLITRRSALRGLLWIAAAPAIVRASSIMPIKALPQITLEDFARRNSILTIDMINREIVKEWRKSSIFLQQVDCEYPETFAIGNHLTIRRPSA